MRLARRMPCGFTYYASAWKICQQRAVVSSVIPCRNGIKRIQRKRRHVECFTRRSSQASTCRLKKRHAKHSSRVVESDGDRDSALAGQVGIPQAGPVPPLQHLRRQRSLDQLEAHRPRSRAAKVEWGQITELLVEVMRCLCFRWRGRHHREKLQGWRATRE